MYFRCQWRVTGPRPLRNAATSWGFTLPTCRPPPTTREKVHRTISLPSNFAPRLFRKATYCAISWLSFIATLPGLGSLLPEARLGSPKRRGRCCSDRGGRDDRQSLLTRILAPTGG